MDEHSDLLALEIAYDLLRGLRASSIASIFDRLWPLFHKDPLETFPPEIMSQVLSYLEPSDLLTIALVSRAWRDRVLRNLHAGLSLLIWARPGRVLMLPLDFEQIATRLQIEK